MKVGICVGHSRRGDKGAVSLGGVSEWDYNNTVAAMLSDQLCDRGLSPLVVNDYNYGSYTSAIGWVATHLRMNRVDLALELHFNAAGATAHGHEWLYWHSSSKGEEAALAFRDSFEAKFPEIRSRGVKPKGLRNRGGMFLQRTHCPALLLEPFFGTNEGDWARFKNASAELASCYADAIESLA